MRNAPWLLVLAGAGLFALLYWGFDHVPPDMRGRTSASGLSLQATSAQALIKEALPTLDARTEAEIHGYSKMLDAASSDTRKREVYELLSGAWYRAGRPALAGHYAQEIAELAPSDTTWGIAGTTFTLCLRVDSLSAKQKAFCEERAVAAYEQAVTLAPEVTTHKVNLALHFADNPPADNPMRGIRMLLDLNRENPDDVSVLVQLGRLALQTSQNEKAVTRLTRAVGLQPDNPMAQCLLAEAAGRTGQAELAAASEKACRALYKDSNNL